VQHLPGDTGPRSLASLPGGRAGLDHQQLHDFRPRDRVRTGPPSRELAVYLALIAGVMAVFTGLWLPFTWGRYYLPVLALVAPLYAAGGAFLFSLVASRELRGKAPDASASANNPAEAISDNVAPNAKLVGR